MPLCDTVVFKSKLYQIWADAIIGSSASDVLHRNRLKKQFIAKWVHPCQISIRKEHFRLNLFCSNDRFSPKEDTSHTTFGILLKVCFQSVIYRALCALVQPHIVTPLSFSVRTVNPLWSWSWSGSCRTCWTPAEMNKFNLFSSVLCRREIKVFFLDPIPAEWHYLASFTLSEPQIGLISNRWSVFQMGVKSTATAALVGDAVIQSFPRCRFFFWWLLL